MRSILLPSTPSEQDALVTALWQHGTAGIIEEPAGLRAFFDETVDLSDVLNTFAGKAIETRVEEPPDPSNFPKQNWDPILVGQRFWIAPSWVHQPTPSGRVRIAIDSSNAFGTGRHESTQLALEALEELVTPASTVLDIGSGSGILSQAALLLGAHRVFSCDIHIDAITTAKSQLQSRLFLGTADALATHAGDIVLVNISAKVIDDLSSELQRVTKADGVLILTGFIEGNPPTHFSPEKVTQRGDWLCWVCRRRSAPGTAGNV